MNAQDRERYLNEKRKKKTDKKGSNERTRLWCMDEWRWFDVYRVPVAGLLLNVENRRFAAERKLYEDKLGRPLDPENHPDDEEALVALLTAKSIEVAGDQLLGHGGSDDYVALRGDWERRKQEAPFWIRPDGTVRNGNRRLAMVKRLRKEGVDGVDWVDAVIFAPRDIDDAELFKMEQREQLTENYKVRYSDINLLLTLRDAALNAEIDFFDEESLARVAAELQHICSGDKDYTLIQLRAIKYMDSYLDYVNAPGHYERLLRQVERFRDVGKTMARIEQDYPDDAEGMLHLLFAAVQAGNPHGDIRALRKMFIEDRKRYRKLKQTVHEDEREWSKNSPSLGNPDPGTPEPEIDDDDDDDDGRDPPGPVVSDYPGVEVKKRIKNAIDGFKAKTLDVASQLETALGRLECITEARLRTALKGEKASEIRNLIKRVADWAEDANQKSTIKQ